MALRICFQCDQAIAKGEPRLVVSGLLIHEHCAIGASGAICDTEDCAYQWTYHAGECVT